ncbi:MAG: competence/damage-inducible protein A [Bacteroidales bacterium]|nr:competence/damage-inducible protein A [Bacteroidales bacterium]
MIAEIITIGDELLIGQVVDTNSAWLGKILSDNGIRVRQIISISDDREHILMTLNERVGRVELILITGGLGPTKDDITKSVLCEFFDTSLVLNHAALEKIEEFFISRALPMTHINSQQAMLPEACIPIPNENGTARGMWFEKDGTIIISMPGVPFEMKPMVSNYVIPEIKKRFDLPVILHKTILTHGIGESFLSDLVETWEMSIDKRIKVAYLPQPGVVRVRLSCTGNSQEEVDSLLGKAEFDFIQIAGKYVFGFDDENLENILFHRLKECNKTLSVAESCTGGYLSHLITSIPGSSSIYKGGVVAYSNEVKRTFLGVNEETLQKYGAVSEQTVHEMAEGIRNRMETDFGIGISGIAGPDGGTTEKPVGTVCIAVSAKEKLIVKTFNFGHLRDNNIRRAALSAIYLLLEQLVKD